MKIECFLNTGINFPTSVQSKNRLKPSLIIFEDASTECGNSNASAATQEAFQFDSLDSRGHRQQKI